MSTQGKIKTLFSDKEKTEALFPRTKINAVSDENGKGLNAILDDMAYVGDITEDVASTPVNADLLGGRPAEEYATQNYVANEIAKAQLESDDVDLSGFATKDEVSAAIRAIDYPVDSVNGRTGAITLNASDVGAHPDTWLPTIAEIGAAPSGFGLGAEAKQVDSWDDAIQTGFYMSPTGPLNGPWFYGFVIRKTDKILIQKVWTNDEQTDTFGCGFYSAERRKLGSTWGEWEWVNPPMKLGVEYRTTERCDGKPVYAKRINCLAAPASVSISNLNIETLVRWSGHVSYYGVALPCSNTSWKVDINRTTISTTSAYEQASAHFYIILYYTKV